MTNEEMLEELIAMPDNLSKHEINSIELLINHNREDQLNERQCKRLAEIYKKKAQSTRIPENYKWDEDQS